MTPDLIVRELRVEWRTVPGAAVLPAVKDPAHVAALCGAWFAGSPVELAVVVCLDTKLRPVAIREIGRGSVAECLMPAAVILQTALLANASGIVVAHCHPSGSVEPSTADLDVARRLAQAGTLIGIPVLDFLVCSTEGGAFWSAQALGLLPS